MAGLADERLELLRGRMRAENIGLLAIGPGAHMTWLLGFHPHADERPCLLLVGPDREAFLMPSLNAEGSRAETDIAFHAWDDADGPDAALIAVIKDIAPQNVARVALDETMRTDFALPLLDKLAGAEPLFTHSTLGELRMRKSPAEIEALKENALINDRAFKAGFAALRSGMTEVELGDVIRSHQMDLGARPEFTIVGAGPNGAFPHHHTGDTSIGPGDAIVIDCGARKGNYPSDMTRMAVVGEPPEGYDQVHAVVDAAVEAALAAIRPGVLAKSVDAAARNVITEAGYGEAFVHRTGHGLGIEVHEPPYITSVSETVLDEGMVFSVEPGIYLPGRFGLRLEEIVVVRADGPEILSELPREVFRAEA